MPTLTYIDSASVDALPPLLWRLARLMLLGLLMGGTSAIIVLAAGAADPLKAGPLRWENKTLPETVLLAKQTRQIATFDLPAVPYTLELTASLSADSDPSATWGITFDDPHSFRVYINGYQFFAVPPVQPDFTPFIHMRGIGEANTMTLTSDLDGTATLRLNNEIAWRGAVPPADHVTITGIGGRQKSAVLHLFRLALYAPLR